MSRVMRTWRSVMWLTALFAAALSAAAADVVSDIDKVQGIEKLKGPAAARDILRRNGFVVVPRFYHQIFSPYIQEDLAPFVTTDSLHRTFHVIFEEQIKKVEEQLAGEVAALTRQMCEIMNDYAHRLTGERAQAARDLQAYFSVAAELLDEGLVVPDGCREAVGQEVAAIRKAKGVAKSALFPEYPGGID